MKRTALFAPSAVAHLLQPTTMSPVSKDHVPTFHNYLEMFLKNFFFKQGILLTHIRSNQS